MRSILIFAHVPPPHHGQSYMVVQLLEELRARPQEFRVFHVDCRMSDTLGEVGQWRPVKVWRMLRYCLQALRVRWQYGPMIFYYVPAPAQRWALYRDWLVMALCRPFFRRRIVLHWHAVGLGEWMVKRADPFTAVVSRFLLGKPDLSLVLAQTVAGDAEVFHPRSIRVLPNGIIDPCPAFETAVLPARSARRRERQGTFRVLFLAHCMPEKGIYDTLEGVFGAQREMQRDGSPLRLRLTIAGQFVTSQAQEKFSETASRLAREWIGDGPPPEVEYVGFAADADKDRMLRESDCFCFPTYYANEVMPITVIEALAYGLPIVATRWRAIPEMLPAEGCFLVDPHQPGQVAAALREAERSDGFAALRAHFLDCYRREVFGQRIRSMLAESFAPDGSAATPPNLSDAGSGATPRDGGNDLYIPASGRQGARTLKLAISILCEHPGRKTGLSTLFHELVSRALSLFPDVDWIVYAASTQEWVIQSPRVEVVRSFPGNDRLGARLFADHFRVPPDARRRGADALLTFGFIPLRKSLPSIMHLLSLQHLDRSNRIGLARRLYRGIVIDRSVHRAELIITNSRSAAGQILNVYPDCADRLVVSNEGLPHEQFYPEAPADESARLAARFDGLRPGFLLWVSNFYPYKQAGLLLDAYARLPAEMRARRPLVMVGGDWGGGLKAARTHAQALGILADVRFLEWIEEEWLAPLYRHARAFVLPSREETFGRSVIEAMACGTPCVVNDIPIMHEVSGGHALIVDFREVSAAAETLRLILADEAAHARLRGEGIDWTARFSFERLVTERITAIRAMLTARGAESH